MSGIRILRQVEVPLRDGTRTEAEVWIPDDDRHPAILVHTPYLTQTAAPTAIVDPRVRRHAATPRAATLCGRGASEGVFESFLYEEADGFDSVEWVAGQPWSHGHVVRLA